MTNHFDAVPIILEVFWKSGVALGAALCVCRLLRNKSADARRLVLSTVVVAMLVSAVALPALPRWEALAPAWFRFERPSVSLSARESPGPAAVDDRAEFTEQASRSALPHKISSSIDLRPWLVPFVWFAFSAAFLMRFAVNLRGLGRLRNASEPVNDADLLTQVARFGGRIRLLRNESIAGPVTWGVFRPVILVPAGFEALPAEVRDAVFCHEFAHIQGHDFLMRALAEVSRAIIWFQPLIWIVRRQLREEQEVACDNHVLAAGGKPSAYAKLLLDWNARPGMDFLIAVNMADRSCLKRRLYALLNPDLRRDTVGGTVVAGTWILGLVMAMALAALGFAQAIPAPTVQTTPAPPVVTAPNPPVQVAQAQPAPSPPPAAALKPAIAAGPPPAPLPKFDAASVQPCQPGDGPGRSGRGDMGANGGVNPNMPEGVGGYFRASPGRMDVTCASVLTMIGMAYIENGTPLRNNPGMMNRVAEQILGLPKWALAPRYTIHAVTGDPAANGQTDAGPGQPGPLPAAKLLYGPMLQSLLEDQFRLRIHRATEEVPMYALAAANSGFKLKPMEEGECTLLAPGQGMRMIGADDKPYCGWVGWPSHGPNRTLLGGGITMERLAQSLGMFVLDRSVIDRTGIAGTFIIRLEYQPDENMRCFGPAEMCKVDPDSDILPGATIFSAMEQQLGLELNQIKGPKEHIVIDRVEQPLQN
jgi:uncharacterized protein (TIGR03435 family)